MSKVIKSKYKASRKLGASVWGESKDAIHKKNYRPGQHGATTVVKASDYGIHLKAKQLLKAHYGRITEKQFKNTFELAHKAKGNSAEGFIGLLERRLDVVVYRLNIAPTIFAARQIVNHNHIKVNGKKVNIPSYKLKEGDIVEVRESAKQIPMVVESTSKILRKIPSYLNFDNKELSGVFIKTPTINEVPYPFEPHVNLIVEFYSR